MKTLRFLPCLAALLLPDRGAAQARMLLLDEGLKSLILVDEADPSAGWARNLGATRGMQLIGNDRVLLSTPKGYLEAELASGEVLLRVESWSGIEDARRLPNGNVLLGGNIGGRITLIEVDQNCLEIRKVALSVPISKGMRQMRIGGDGNLYIAADDKVHVARLDGSLVRSLAVPGGDGCYKALRSADGTVWASSGYGGTVVQMSETGSVLKTFAIPAADKSPVAADPNFLADFQLLENGNVLATVWHGHTSTAGGHGKALIEFDPQGRAAWSWEGKGTVSSLHGAIRLDGINAGVLQDERTGPVKPQPYAFPVPGPGVPKITWTPADLFQEIGEIIVPPAPPDTTSAYPNGNNYVTMYKGYMFVPFASDHMLNQGGFQFWDISDPRRPKAAFTHNDKTTRNVVEVHGYGFTSVAGRDYACFQDKLGISIWDFTDIRNLRKISTLSLPGIGNGGYDNGVFGTFWQHPYLYAAGSAHGVFVIDTRDLAKPKLVKQIPTSAMGGFRIGNTFALGNLLMASTVAGVGRGAAFFDISNPANPVLLSSPDTRLQSFYSVLINGNKLYIGGKESGTQPAVLYVYEFFNYPDILLDGKILDIKGTGEYQFVQDDNVIFGMESIWYKAGTRNGNYRVLGSGIFPETTYHGQQEGNPTPLGNIMLLGDDHTRASGIFAHDLNPDNAPPAVNMVVPANGALSQALTSRVGVSFSDQVDIQSVGAASFVVRPKGGQPLKGHYSVQQCIANFFPESPLAADQVYEVVVSGIKDVSGNAMPSPFVSAFSTGKAAFTPPGSVTLKGKQLAVTAPAAAGLDAGLAADADPKTHWQGPAAFPLEIVLDLKAAMKPHRLKYYPRKDAEAGGFITRYEVHASADRTAWTKVAEGSWDANLNTKYADFALSAPAAARYLKLVALAAVGGAPSAIEFAVEAGTGETVVVGVRDPSGRASGRNFRVLPYFGGVAFADVGPLARVEILDAAGGRRLTLTPRQLETGAFPRPGPGLYLLRFIGPRGMSAAKAVL